MPGQEIYVCWDALPMQLAPPSQTSALGIPLAVLLAVL